MIEVIHLLKNGAVKSYYKVGESLIPYTRGIEKYSEINFDNEYTCIKEARYNALLFELHKGKRLSDYKVSPYYQYYIERLSEEHPEFLI